VSLITPVTSTLYAVIKTNRTLLDRQDEDAMTALWVYHRRSGDQPSC